MRLLIIMLVMLCCSCVRGQHAAVYSQYLFNGLVSNPAYAGSQDLLSFTTFYRTQWTGIEGAPKTFGVAAHTPLRNKKINAGFILINDELGITKQTRINAVYAYRFKMSDGQFSFGLQGGINSYRSNWNAVQTTEANDPSFSFGIERRVIPEAGFGAYYYNRKSFAGISAPVLITWDDNVLSYKPYFIYFGTIIRVNEKLELKPVMQVKYLEHSPLQADISATAYWNKAIGAGINYRTGDALTAFFDLQLNAQMRLGYAYDHTFSKLRDYSNGTHEVMLQYLFEYKVNLKSPRYF